MNTQGIAASLESVWWCPDGRVLEKRTCMCHFCTWIIKVQVAPSTCVTCAWVDVLYLIHVYVSVWCMHCMEQTRRVVSTCALCAWRCITCIDNAWSSSPLQNWDSWGGHYWAFWVRACHDRYQRYSSKAKILALMSGLTSSCSYFLSWKCFCC